MHAIFAGSLLSSAVSLVVDASWKALGLLLIATLAAFLAQRSSAALRHRIWCLSFLGLVFLPVLCLVVPRLWVPLRRGGSGRRPTRTGRSPADVSERDCRRRPDRWLAAGNRVSSRTGRNGSAFGDQSTPEHAGRGAGCHAHGSAWACLRTSNGFARTILGEMV